MENAGLLIDATRRGDYKLVEKLLKQKALPSTPIMVPVLGETINITPGTYILGETTAFGEACTHGYTKLIKLMLEYDNTIDIETQEGRAMQWAAALGDVTLIELLISKGFNLDKYGVTPLKIAAVCGKVLPLKALLQHGVRFGNDFDDIVKTAEDNRHSKMAGWLKKNRAEICKCPS